MKFSIKDLFSKCDQIHRNCGLVTFNEEILNGNLHFLRNGNYIFGISKSKLAQNPLNILEDNFKVITNNLLLTRKMKRLY